jgi:hypothetical protein
MLEEKAEISGLKSLFQRNSRNGVRREMRPDAQMRRYLCKEKEMFMDGF